MHPDVTIVNAASVTCYISDTIGRSLEPRTIVKIILVRNNRKLSSSGRLQCVVLGNKLSSYSNVLSGIVQGSVLGPLFFILFVNDLTDIFGNEADSKLFADDLKLYSSYELNSANLLQNALDKLVKWSSDWQLSLNPLKSNVLYLGKSNSRSIYTIKHVEIVSSDLIRVSEILESGSIVALSLVAMCKTLSRCHTNSWQFYSGVSVQKTLLYWLELTKYMCDRSWNTVRQSGLHTCFMRLMKSKGCSDILRVGCRV